MPEIVSLQNERAWLRFVSSRAETLDVRTKLLRNAITLYAILWLIEGGLRRWVFPSWADPLLVVRDPVVIWIYLLAARVGMFRMTRIEIAMLIVTMIGFFATFIVGHGNLAVALYGARTLVLHLPLMFVMGRALDLRYIDRLSKVVLLVIPLMTILLVDQFYSPQSAFVNVGVGGVGSAGFSGTLDRYRPPGTWSFISGPVYLYTLGVSCFFYQILRRQASVLLLTISGLCILLACPVSISRTFIISAAIVAMLGIVVLVRFQALSSMAVLRAGLVALLGLLALSQLPVLRDAEDAFATRWYLSTTAAGGVSDALVSRFLETLTGPIETALEQPGLGQGLGKGTNVGSKLLVGQVTFLGGETEWFRVIFELGPVLGVIYICLRISLAVNLLKVSLKSWRHRNPAPILFFATAVLPIFQGQWGQPTSLGFAVFSGGLVLAAARTYRRPDKERNIPTHRERRYLL